MNCKPHKLGALAPIFLCALGVLFAGCRAAHAEPPAPPGQISEASPIFPAPQPIRLSPNGEAPIASLRASRPEWERKEHRAKVLWGISLAALVGASTFDAFSSVGKTEGNPLLRSGDGTFGAKGIAIKASLTGAGILPQVLFRNRKETRRLFTIFNFAEAGMFTAVATRNLGIARQR